MFATWARAYAERWGLPHAAVSELIEVLEAASRGQNLPLPTPARSDPPTEPPASERGHHRSDPEERYEDMGVIGEGGMGEVLRKWDNALNRAVAMKILRRDLCDREDLVVRFIEEAQATAQLEHPGIVPVYGFGRLPDGRPYFTMKEIRGRSLLDVIEELHAASDGSWGTTPSGWTLGRVISVFQQVCEAVAYAHSRGVLHRDLKPTNVMVGAFGEVVVMDWGLAKIGGTDTPVRVIPSAQVVTNRSRGGMFQTRSGSVAGTPNYMPPEQARGDHGRIGPWSDVYSLGALLYEILADRAPYDGDDLDEVVAKVLAGPPPQPYPRWHTRRPDEPHAEEALRRICAKAMSRDLADRYMDASTLAEAISAWLETAGQREAASQFVRRAELLEPEVATLRSRLFAVRTEAERRLADLPLEASIEEKRPAWALEDQAAEIEQDLEKIQSRYTELLQAALAASPDFPEAVSRLDAMKERSTEADTGRGALSLRTEPPGATVVVHRVDSIDRRLVAVPAEDAPKGPLRTPLDSVSFPAGVWQLDLFAPGHAPLRVLARVVGGERWSVGPTPMGKVVSLAALGEDPPDVVRIPGGWFLCGGDREQADSLPQSRAWVGPFLIGRYPVSCEQWLAFLESDPSAEALSPPGFVRGPGGRFRLPVGWEPEQPVRRIRFEAAMAYAAWVGRRTGKPWRLPRELEWEKAARGVDGRLFPWGNYIDPTFCCIAGSHGGEPPRPASIYDFPLDTSPYEVRGMGGNVRDWVIDERSPKRSAVLPEHRLVKGGHYLGVAQFARSALRYSPPLPDDDTIGFRIACPLD